MNLQTRVIIHIDLDAFFAAVEVLENPALQGKPVVVGGRPESRGVVSSASYPARAFGIRSAMPMSRALVLCPEAIILPPRHRLYSDYSRRVMELLHETSSLVEQMSVDEAFLDLTDLVATWEAGVETARRLQRRVDTDIGLSASLGVATNKLLAKVASDQDKPGGLTVVSPGEEAAFLAPLSVQVLWGIGPVTAQKLAAIGVTTVGDLAQTSDEVLRERFGRHGPEMARQARGIDDRPLVSERELKSVSQEHTFTYDLADEETLRRKLWQLSQAVSQRLKAAELTASTIVVKLRYADFTTLTRQTSLPVPTDDAQGIYRAVCVLFDRVWQRGRRVRLLGVAARQLRPPIGQLPLLLEGENSL